MECTSISSPFNVYLTAHVTDNIISVKMQLSRQALSLCNSTSHGASVLVSHSAGMKPPGHLKHKFCGGAQVFATAQSREERRLHYIILTGSV